MPKSHGGARSGAGRPSLPEHLKKKTAAIRVPAEMADKIKSGYYQRLEVLLAEWKSRADDAPVSSPRWQRLREFLAELENL